MLAVDEYPTIDIIDRTFAREAYFSWDWIVDRHASSVVCRSLNITFVLRTQNSAFAESNVEETCIQSCLSCNLYICLLCFALQAACLHSVIDCHYCLHIRAVAHRASVCLPRCRELPFVPHLHDASQSYAQFADSKSFAADYKLLRLTHRELIADR